MSTSRRNQQPDSPNQRAPRAWVWAVPPRNYPVYVKTRTFAIRKVGRRALDDIRPGDTIFAYLSGSRVIAGMFEAVGTAFQDTTPLVTGGHYPYRLRVRPVAALSEEAWVPYDAFHDRLEVTREYPDFGAVVRQVLHPLPKVDEKVLEFLVRARQASDLETVMHAYGAYLEARQERGDDVSAAFPGVQEPPAPYTPTPFDGPGGMQALIDDIEQRGYVFEPWQIAAYVAALRTKPFVILAGVTGTGKSRLPALVEAATGGVSHLVPVRPDWTDSADVIGYMDLQGRFRPGALLYAARSAQHDPARHHTCIIDEMNLARVEHYFAEVLSRIEDRRPARDGGLASAPLTPEALPEAAGDWRTVGLPPNLALVGTVNMDESTHGFSRKVLDRAFTLELADIDLLARPDPPAATPLPPARWPADAWYPLASRLSELPALDDEGRALVDRAVQALAATNALLIPAQVQIAYRTRDEVALFLLHAAAFPEAFRTRAGTPVDPLDLALHMKVLPRLAGGSAPLRHAVLGMLGWAATGTPFRDAAEARSLLDTWTDAGRPTHLPDARFPRSTARLCLMWERLTLEGFTSFWI